MPGGVKKDSIGRSDLYNNPYDLRFVSNTSMKKVRAENFQDTMENTQMKLEKDLFRQLQEGYFKLPKGGLLYLVYLGKGVFFVMMVPPYLFFYGLPKWLLLQASPAAMNALKKGAKSLKEQFQKAILNHLQEIASKIAARLEKLGRGFHTSAEAIADILKKMTEKLKNIASENIQKLNAAMEPIIKAAEIAKEAAKWVQNKTNTTLEGAKALLNKALEFAKNPLQNMAEIIKETAKKFQDLAKKSVNALTETLEKNLLRHMRELQEKISEHKEKFNKALSEASKKRILEPGSKILDRIKDKTDAALDFLREKQEKFVERAKDLGNKTVEMTQNIASIAQNAALGLIQLVPQPMINFFVPVATVAGALWRAPRRITMTGKKIAKKLQEWGQSASKWFFAKAKKGAQVLSKVIYWTWEKAKKIPSKVWRFLCAAAWITIEAVRRILFMLRLLVAWIKVLIKYGFFQIRTFVNG